MGDSYYYANEREWLMGHTFQDGSLPGSFGNEKCCVFNLCGERRDWRYEIMRNVLS